MFAIGFSPDRLHACDQAAAQSEVEVSLAKWFQRPVVLTSSGRAALRLCFQQLGLKRYESRVAMSPRTAQCVFDALTRSAFPVDPARDRGPVDATLLIHQYGHLQIERPEGPVVEDICHAFFAAPDSGSRKWVGDMAVFSLPKFFPTAGMVGGIVAANEVLAQQLRDRRDAVSPLFDEQRKDVILDFRVADTSSLELLYLRALLHPAPNPAALSGLPLNFPASGWARQKVVTAIVEALPKAVLDDDWRDMVNSSLPFAIPVFAAPEHLVRLVSELNRKGCESGLFLIDRARRMSTPQVEQAALLPCHGMMTEDDVGMIVDTLLNWSTSLRYR